MSRTAIEETMELFARDGFVCQVRVVVGPGVLMREKGHWNRVDRPAMVTEGFNYTLRIVRAFRCVHQGLTTVLYVHSREPENSRAVKHRTSI